MSRVYLATGLHTRLTRVPDGLDNGLARSLAIEAGGATALVAHLLLGPATGVVEGRVIRIPLTHPIRALAPARQSFDVLFETFGVALEAGAVTTIASGFAWVVDVIAESNGTTALVSTGGSIERVNLATGTRTTIGVFPFGSGGRGFALEAGGNTVLITTIGPDGLARMNLTTGALTQLMTGLYQPIGVAIESGGATALVAENTYSRLLRVNTTTGAISVFAPDITPGPGAGGQFLAIESSGTALVTIGSTLMRVGPAPRMPAAVTPALLAPKGFTVTSTRALFLDCGNGAPNCLTSGRLASTDLTTGAVTTIVAGLNTPTSIELESGGTTALITECGPSNQLCATHGRVLRVTLANGSLAVVAAGLNNPDGIAIEPGGATALVCERGQGRLLRVELASGTTTVVATGLGSCSGVRLETKTRPVKELDRTAGLR